MHILRNRDERPVNLLRLATTAVIGCVTIGGVLDLPVRSRETAPFVIEPHAAHPIFLAVPGTLREVCVHDGQHVTGGDVLARFTNDTLLHDQINLSEDFGQQQIEALLAHAVADSGQELLANEGLQAIALQREAASDDLQALTVRAPCDGTILLARNSSEQAATAIEHEETSDSLCEMKLGSVLPAGSQLASIHASGRWQAALLVNPRASRELEVLQSVQIRLDAYPERVLIGHVMAIAPVETHRIPSALSQHHGGVLPTQAGAADSDLHSEALTLVTVLLDPSDLRFCKGMRGRARFEVRSRTIGSILRELGQQTFRTL
jgi:multidrug efflux pump subunit AcrA (membrane-fusion protein)